MWYTLDCLAAARTGFIHSDHLGSISLTTDITGTVVAETRYLPYGEERWTNEAQPTDFAFTGQRAERGFALMDYNARYYDPWLGRFVSADTVVPEAGNPQALNRYSYAIGNPLGYTDPTGHCADPASALVCIALVQLVVDAAAVGLGLHLIHNANQDIAELNPPPYHLDNSSEIEAETFPLGPPPDPYSPPGVELDVPEWPGLPGVPLDQPDTGTRAIDLPLEQQGIGNNVLPLADQRRQIERARAGLEKARSAKIRRKELEVGVPEPYGGGIKPVEDTGKMTTTELNKLLDEAANNPDIPKWERRILRLRKIPKIHLPDPDPFDTD
jgi:RHS repeat-associated protein